SRRRLRGPGQTMTIDRHHGESMASCLVSAAGGGEGGSSDTDPASGNRPDEWGTESGSERRIGFALGSWAHRVRWATMSPWGSIVGRRTRVPAGNADSRADRWRRAGAAAGDAVSWRI